MNFSINIRPTLRDSLWIALRPPKAAGDLNYGASFGPTVFIRVMERISALLNNCFPFLKKTVALNG
jgi:hypothetical protein